MTVLAALSVKESGALGPTFRGWFTRGCTLRISKDRLVLAVVESAGGARQAAVFASHAWDTFLELPGLVVDLLARRWPPWVPDFVAALLADNLVLGWQIARSVVRSGLAPAPDHPQSAGDAPGLSRSPPPPFAGRRVELPPS